MIPITFKRNEARVDSRLIAQALGNRHKAVVQLIERYAAEMRGFGILPFEMEKFEGRGRPERFALLNEDQAFFLLTLSRNTARVVELKAKLVVAFRDARHKAELNQEYLPSYHELHSQLHVLASGSPNERWVHANLNKLLNKAAGIKAGTRAIADVPHKALLIVAQHLATQAIRDAPDHHEAYRRAKRALEPLTLPHTGG
ncbi:MAG: Rha family transcriptional regulator [Comamonadaceae bacterium]|nr:Rha family transcriptional regulator [Comamonadaceae bacterium]